MSANNHHQSPCNEFLHAIVLYIDHEIDDSASVEALELHFQQCPPCAEKTAIEAELNHQLKALLNRSCHEAASEQLHKNVQAMIRQPQFEWHQSITYTEITSDTFIQTRVEIHERYESEEER
jgi:mycothiol system anti-sigma-R factor